MEYISAEEFLKQPIEVQKVFLDWWQPSLGDLYFWNETKDLRYIDESKNMRVINEFRCFQEISPALVEGQLRKFIEDKTCGISSIYFRCNNISINIYDNNSPTCIKRYERLGIDLLQAYWIVALEIAKEKVKA